ncbi:hypothetical protein [Chelativorans salis]|uniref:Uncharacterized protein n=1 Tax=Chelativorans salis TaxID=2978478 RepID=A0ABT2LVX3_9HYPH|nr:hypothetical protein [Chelativorans sp. EGI FJ00035]MCT7377314.1 hypothetical protein [Chelativorans sp. EGI FJ00035]
MFRELLTVAAITTFTAHPTTALSQALFSDQRDAIAHMANAVIADEQCEMRVNQEVLNATMRHVGLGLVDLEAQPYRAAVAEAAQEAQLSLQVFGSQVVCDRLDAMYGPTGLRIPGLIAR